MARLDTSTPALTNDGFSLEAKLERTPAEISAAERDCDLELLYLVSLARRRASAFSGTSHSNSIVLRMAGWE